MTQCLKNWRRHGVIPLTAFIGVVETKAAEEAEEEAAEAITID